MNRKWDDWDGLNILKKINNIILRMGYDRNISHNLSSVG